jgi:hypothetical protein
MRLVMFAVLGLTAFAQAPVGLAGRWRTAGSTKSGLGALFEFRDDGTFNFSVGAVVESKYRIEGTHLILPPGTNTGPEQRQTMEWLNVDHLVLNGNQTLSRQGAARDSANPILGEWTTPREAEGVKAEVTWFFEPAGKSLLVFPFKWQQGKYSVKGATIRIEYPGEKPVGGRLRLEGDLLTIPNSSGAASQLRRY